MSPVIPNIPDALDRPDGLDSPSSININSTTPLEAPPHPEPARVLPELQHLVYARGVQPVPDRPGMWQLVPWVATRRLFRRRHFMEEASHETEQLANGDGVVGRASSYGAEPRNEEALVGPFEMFDGMKFDGFDNQQMKNNVTSVSNVNHVNNDNSKLTSNHLSDAACQDSTVIRLLRSSSSDLTTRSTIDRLEHTLSLSNGLVRDLHEQLDEQAFQLEEVGSRMKNLMLVVDKANDVLAEAYASHYALLQELEGLLEREKMARREKAKESNGGMLPTDWTSNDEGSQGDGLISSMRDLKKIVNYGRRDAGLLRDKLHEISGLINSFRSSWNKDWTETGIQACDSPRP